MKQFIAEIAGGQRRAGDQLPREVDLAERFKISRGIARECIRGLEERGLVTVKHGRGATISEPERWNVFDREVFEALIASESQPQLIAQVLESWRIFALEAACLAAERAAPEQLRALVLACEQMRVALQRVPADEQVLAAVADAELRFHRGLFAATGNIVLAHLSEPIDQAALELLRVDVSPAGLSARLEEHERVVETIRERAPERAREAMRLRLTGIHDKPPSPAPRPPTARRRARGPRHRATY